MATTFLNKVEILASLFANYSEDPEFVDFVEYNDLGLPLAHLAKEGLAAITVEGEGYIEETWLLFVESLGLDDTGFETLDEIFAASSSTE